MVTAYKPQIYFFVSGMIIYKTKIQQEVYSKSWCFAHSMLSCLPSLDLCKMCERPMQEFFPGLLCMDEFFSLIFPLHEFFFFVLRPPPAPPSPHKFCNGPSLTRPISLPANSRLISGREATTGNTSAVRRLPISGQLVLFPDQETWMVFKITLFKLFITVCEVYMR